MNNKEVKKIILSNGEAVEMKCPTVKVLKNAHKKSDDEFERSIFMIASVINMTSDEVEELPLNDFVLLSEGLETFLQKPGGATRKASL